MKVGKRPIKEGKRANWQFSGTPSCWQTAPLKGPIKRSITSHPPKKDTVAPILPPTARGVTGQFLSENRSLYTEISQLHCRVSRYTVPRSVNETTSRRHQGGGALKQEAMATSNKVLSQTVQQETADKELQK